MEDPSGPDEGLPPSLRLLRLLVTVLTAVMIAGIVIIVALIWTRYSDPAVPLPERIALPDGAVPLAFTEARSWFAVVTDDDRILIFDRSSGALRQEIAIDVSAGGNP